MKLKPKTIVSRKNQHTIVKSLEAAIDTIIEKGSPSEKLLGVSLLIMISSMTEHSKKIGAGIEVVAERLLDIGINTGIIHESLLSSEEASDLLDKRKIGEPLPPITGKINVLAMIEKYNDPRYDEKNFKHDVLGGSKMTSEAPQEDEEEYVKRGLLDIKEFVDKNNIPQDGANALIQKFLSDTKSIYGNTQDIEMLTVSIGKDKLSCSLSHILFMAFQDFMEKCQKAKNNGENLDKNDIVSLSLIKLLAFSHKTGTSELVWDLFVPEISRFEAIISVLSDYCKSKKISMSDMFLDENLLDMDELTRTFERHMNNPDIMDHLKNELGPDFFTEDSNG